MENPWKIASILLVVFIFFSCKQEEITPNEDYVFANVSRKLDGIHDLVDMTSETAVDLDRDGNSSRDILSEANEWKNSRRYFLEFETVDIDGNSNLFYQKMFLWVPFTHVIADLQGNYLYTGYSYTNLAARSRFHERENRIEIKNGSLGQGEVLSALVKNDESISVRFIQRYYTTKGWENLMINATYKKRI